MKLTLDSKWVRFLGFLLEITPNTHIFRPLWNVIYSYWDDATGCQCWREVHTRRWQG